MSYEIVRDHDAGSLIIRGALNIENVYRLKDALQESLHEASHVIFDVKRIEDISFACLQLLCSACRSACKRKKRFSVTSRYNREMASLTHKIGFTPRVRCAFNSGVCTLGAPQCLPQSEKQGQQAQACR